MIASPCLGIAYSRRFTVILEPAEEGSFIVKCLEFPVASQGESKKEALNNIREAIEGYLEVKAEIYKSKARGERVEIDVEAPPSVVA